MKAKFLMAIITLLLTLSGYSLLAPATLDYFPANIILFFIIFFTITFNFVDVKDYSGDKKSGIKTIPTIFGENNGKKIIGSASVFAYTITPFFLNKFVLLLPSIVSGIILFHLINRKKYNDNTTYLFYLFTLIVIFGFYFLF